MLRRLIATAVLRVAVATAVIAVPAVAGAGTNNVPLSGPMQGDSAFGADMNVVHKLLFSHSKIKRTVTKLPNGIRAVTESDDPQVAQYIKDHVATMKQRMKDGKVFNVASHTLPTIFANADKIKTQIQQTPKGVILTQTSSDPAVIVALQAHAGEVSDLARDGMVALMRSVMANGGPIQHRGTGTAQTQMGPGMMGMMGMMNAGPMMAQMRQMMHRNVAMMQQVREL
jgi:hypothetical protein